MPLYTPWSRVLLEKLNGSQLYSFNILITLTMHGPLNVKKKRFSVTHFMGPKGFITPFTTAHLLSLF